MLLVRKCRLVFLPSDNAAFYHWVRFQAAMPLLLSLSLIIKWSCLLTWLQVLLFKTIQNFKNIVYLIANGGTCDFQKHSTYCSYTEAMQQKKWDWIFQFPFKIMVYMHNHVEPWNVSSNIPVQMWEFTKSVEHFLVLILNTFPPTLVSL